ncbi:hypothetical protein ZWY2020_039362 [Hordeum vulgare]|nr:hypothetical protein ZWY2020_039362 [Hordeum vulgare]
MPSPSPCLPCSGSRFEILGSVSLSHLGEVAFDCDIAFCGEKGPCLEKILAIYPKEWLDEDLCEARTRVELRSEDAKNPIAPRLGGPSVNPTSEESGHREPRVEDRLGSLGLSPSVCGDPALGRVPWGRPPTHLHPTK